MNRQDAVTLLKEHVKTDRVYRHSLAVEAAMISYAKKFGEDETYWGNIGLLHDIDFEKYPEEHPDHAGDLLIPAGFDQPFVDDILSHGLKEVVPRDTQVRKCLHACDEMASFIIAVALMRPTRLEGLKAKSVKKKMKTASFAKAVNREELTSSAEALGVEFAEHVDTIVSGLMAHEDLLQQEGATLLG